jgi:hypothetical protein
MMTGMFFTVVAESSRATGASFTGLTVRDTRAAALSVEPSLARKSNASGPL